MLSVLVMVLGTAAHTANLGIDPIPIKYRVLNDL